MIEIRKNVRNDLYDLDNVSNLLNYAVNETINRHYKAETDEEKKNIAQQTSIR